MNLDRLIQATIKIGRYRERWEDLGTCFLAPIYSLKNPSSQVVITAYHVIAESHRKNERLFVMDPATERLIPATVECYPASETWRYDNDFAVLSLQDTFGIEPVLCANYDQDGRVVIRGQPEGLETEFASVRAYCNGLERRKGDKHSVLDITCQDFFQSRVPAEGIEKAVTPHDVWRGMSGAPITLYEPDKTSNLPYVIGVFTRLAAGARAGRAYGVPMKVIAEACNSKELSLDLAKCRPKDENIEYSTVSVLFRGVEDPIRERHLWDWISDMSFVGIPAHDLLLGLSTSSTKYGLDACDLAFLEYFRARLLLKRGQTDLGNLVLRQSINTARSASKVVEKRINALAQTRLMLEEPVEHVWKQIAKINHARRAIEELQSVPDGYITVELASFIGWEATKLLLLAGGFDADAQIYLTNLLKEHASLLQKNPVLLQKQDVVYTVNNILCLLHGVTQTDDISGELQSLCNVGFDQSKRRKNSIFFTKMLFVKAISYWLGGQRDKGFSILWVVGQVLRRGNLTLKHEGIAQLFRYVKSNMPICANILDISFQYEGPLTIKEKRELSASVGIPYANALTIIVKANQWLEEMMSWHLLYNTPINIFD